MYIFSSSGYAWFSGLRRSVTELFAFPGCYTALIGSYFPTFRDNFSVPSSTVNLSQKYAFLKFLTFADGNDRLSQKSVNDYQSTLRND